jgi:hypothetical protein
MTGTLYLTAYKAEFGTDGSFSYMPMNADHKDQKPCANRKEADAALDEFCASLPFGPWIVFGTWRGPRGSRTPPGLKSIPERRLNPAATA